MNGKSAAIRPFRVLVVDDHSEMRRLICELLAGVGEVLRDCASGEEAIQVCGGFEPDVVTIDLQLKDMNGMAAMRVIRSLYPQCHLIVVTHYDGAELRRRALAAGANHFLSKDELLALAPYVASLRDASTRSRHGRG